MSRPTDLRKSGKTQADEVTEAESAKNDEIESTHEDLTHAVDKPRSKFRSLGLTRMKFDWNREDALVISRAKRIVDQRIMEDFSDAFQIMYDLYSLVRVPVVDPETGEVIRDQFGWPEWQRTSSGGWEEDWSALGRKQREDFLFAITTRLFAWEQVAADAWGEAMFAKSAWEEVFYEGYAAPASGTEGDRTSHGRRQAVEERNFAVFLTIYSKKADAICRTMSNLGQRLKDTFDLS